jgi:hypothetical protein
VYVRHGTKHLRAPRKRRTSENSVCANFYEKALFVKTDVAVAPCGRVQLLSALRALCFYSHFQ